MSGDPPAEEVAAHLAGALELLLEDLHGKRRPTPAWVQPVAALLRRWATPRGTPTTTIASVPEPPLLLTFAQAAERLNRGVRTVERRVADGLLPAVREGGQTMIRTVDLDAYVASLPRVDVPTAAIRRQPPPSSAAAGEQVHGDVDDHHHDDAA